MYQYQNQSTTHLLEQIHAESRRRNILIPYGTTNGTAREVALRIAREAYSFTEFNDYEHYLRPEVLSMKELSMSYLAERWQEEGCIVLFVISTTGQGEFPEDSKAFWTEICRKRDATDLKIRFAVVALGDSSYEMYNYPGKKLYRRLQQLHATPIINICLCDDQHDLGYLGKLNPFLKEFWHRTVPKEYIASRNSAPVPRYTLGDVSEDLKKPEPPRSRVVERRAVLRNDRLTAPDHFQDTRLIEFDTTGSNLKFVEGDALMVYAENLPENVELFFKLFSHLKNLPPFHLLCEANMDWEQIPPEMFDVCGPMPWTWETVATHLLDLQSIPVVYVFEILRSITRDPIIKEKFDEFCSPEGMEDFYNYVTRPRRTILEVLQDFPFLSDKISYGAIFDIFPFMRPRAFSIASPPKETNHMEILVAVVEYKTNLEKPRKGTCSYWLAHHCKIGQTVAIYCEKGSLRPPNVDCHMIMVGPGTGVAPFRSMIKQHINEWDKHLFFGCRNKDKDYYFGEELQMLSRRSDSKWFTFYTAFSRDEEGQKLAYVQDIIAQKVKFIKAMMDSRRPLFIYVCGRAGDMPKDVKNTFRTMFDEMGCNADELLRGMLATGQYQTELY